MCLSRYKVRFVSFLNNFFLISNVPKDVSMQVVPMTQPFICKYLNTKLFNVKVNDRKVVITFVAIIVLEKFLKDVLNVLIPFQFGIVVCKDFTSRYGKYELSGIVYIT